MARGGLLFAKRQLHKHQRLRNLQTKKNIPRTSGESPRPNQQQEVTLPKEVMKTKEDLGRGITWNEIQRATERRRKENLGRLRLEQSLRNVPRTKKEAARREAEDNRKPTGWPSTAIVTDPRIKRDRTRVPPYTIPPGGKPTFPDPLIPLVIPTAGGGDSGWPEPTGEPPTPTIREIEKERPKAPWTCEAIEDFLRSYGIETSVCGNPRGRSIVIQGKR